MTKNGKFEITQRELNAIDRGIAIRIDHAEMTDMFTLSLVKIPTENKKVETRIITSLN